MIRDRKYHLKTYRYRFDLDEGFLHLEILTLCFRGRQCCVGTELVDWLVMQSACVLTRSHAVGMWQALLEEGVLNHGD